MLEKRYQFLRAMAIFYRFVGLFSFILMLFIVSSGVLSVSDTAQRVGEHPAIAIEAVVNLFIGVTFLVGGVLFAMTWFVVAEVIMVLLAIEENSRRSPSAAPQRGQVASGQQPVRRDDPPAISEGD